MFKTYACQKNLGTLTWSGLTAPSGTVTKVYKYMKHGGLIHFWFYIHASTPGILVTGVEFGLPSEVPSPSLWTSQPNNQTVMIGNGAITSGLNASIDSLDGVRLYRNNSGNYIVSVNKSASVAADSVWGYLTFLA